MKMLRRRRAAEARHILATRGQYKDAEDLVSHQMDLIFARGNSVLVLATVVLTITGFSGPTISRTSVLSAVTMGLGLLLTLASLAVVLMGSFKMRWVSQFTTPPIGSSSSDDEESAATAIDGGSTTFEVVELQSQSQATKEAQKRVHALEMLEKLIAFRDAKHRMTNISLTLLCMGLVAYVASFLDFIIENTWPPGGSE